MINKLKYYFAYLLSRVRIHKKDNLEELNLNGKSLVIAAHSDDETIGCYNLLKNKANFIDVLYLEYLGSNSSFLNKEIRLREISTALRRLSRKLLLRDSYNLETLLKYNNIFIPSPIDWHPEHRDLVKSFLKLLPKKVPFNIFLYQETIPLPTKYLSHYSQMNKKGLMEKWKFISEIYKSQSNLPWERFYYTERINGVVTSKFSAEVYCQVSESTLFMLFDKSLNNVEELNTLKLNINNIYRVRNLVNFLA